MGVWIETKATGKPVKPYNVTPYVGVWIETRVYMLSSAPMMSLLMWECGLKHGLHGVLPIRALSLLMWECGLKREGASIRTDKLGVTPYVGVWIETLRAG